MKTVHSGLFNTILAFLCLKLSKLRLILYYNYRKFNICVVVMETSQKYEVRLNKYHQILRFLEEETCFLQIVHDLVETNSKYFQNTAETGPKMTYFGYFAKCKLVNLHIYLHK